MSLWLSVVRLTEKDERSLWRLKFYIHASNRPSIIAPQPSYKGLMVVVPMLSANRQFMLASVGMPPFAKHLTIAFSWPGMPFYDPQIPVPGQQFWYRIQSRCM